MSTAWPLVLFKPKCYLPRFLATRPLSTPGKWPNLFATLRKRGTAFSMEKSCLYRAARPEMNPGRQILVLLVLLSCHLTGQDLSQTVKGSVVDKQSQAPLPGVVVQVMNTTPPLGAMTDENGRFRI